MSNVACSSILVRWRIMKISMDHNIRLKINLRPNGAYIFWRQRYGGEDKG